MVSFSSSCFPRLLSLFIRIFSPDTLLPSLYCSFLLDLLYYTPKTSLNNSSQSIRSFSSISSILFNKFLAHSLKWLGIYNFLLIKLLYNFCCVSPTQGIDLFNNSQNIIPKDHMSHLLVYFNSEESFLKPFYRICGAMQLGVPTIEERTSSSKRDKILDKPKSAILNSFLELMRIF